MKKRIILLLAALTALLSCSDIGFERDNPWDKGGKKWNGGYWTLTIEKTGDCGTVSLPVGANKYYEEISVPVRASADGDCEFTGWTGELNIKDANVTIMMDGNKTLTANFQIIDSTQPWCDGTPPQLTLVGGTTTIYTNDGQAELNRLMGRGTDGWTGVVSWTGEGVKMADVRLTVGGVADVAWAPGSMPAPGQYVIVYRATKDTCRGVVPEAVVQRGLVIIEYIVSNENPPIVRLLGQVIVSVAIGQPYIDPGVDAQEANGTVIPLDSIRVTNDNGGSVGISIIKAATTQAALSQLNTQLTAKNGVAGTYVVTYYVTSKIPGNGKTAVVSRTVEFKEMSSVGLPIPVIVLNKYTHSFGGKTIEHVDTAFAAGGAYREIGVKEVYYMKDGVKTSIPVVNVTLPSVQGSNTPVQRTAVYTLPASANTYQSAIATRYVYIWDRDCEPDKLDPPTITWSDGLGDALTLKLSDSPWDYRNSWRASGNDDALTATRKYLVDLGGLERLETSGDGSASNRAVLRTGTYTITYVGLGGCGGTTVKTRTLTVMP